MEGECMSHGYEEEDFETELVLLPDLKNLHEELISENIKEQIKNPFDIKTNFVEMFSESFVSALESQDLDSDSKKKIISEAKAFYINTINLIDEKFDLECDTETFCEQIATLKDYCEAMYWFFVIKYKKNAKNIMVKYIIKNKKSICNNLEYFKKKKDVTTVSLKRKISDVDTTLLVSNLPEVLDYIKSLDIPMDKLITYLNLDNYYIGIINSLINNCIIRSDFQYNYLSALYEGQQDINYDDILTSIQRGLVENLKIKQ